jgi:glycosyltransferase involved in cell wall biosynthesis
MEFDRCRTGYVAIAKLIIIGVPVYNGKACIKRALESIRSQTHESFRVIISDNASTDGTREICESIARNDTRFSYIRQNRNIGAFENFKFLIDNANSEYFVYLAADDYWEPEFLELNISNLFEDQDAVASISKVDFVKCGVFLRHSNGDHEIKGSEVERLRQYLNAPTDNSRFYSVFKTEVLRDAIRDAPSFHALDWYMMALTLTKGHHLCLDKVLMHREVAESNRYQKTVSSDNEEFFAGKYFPVLPMTYALQKKLSILHFLELVGPLLNLNKIKHKEYIAYKYPESLYGKLLKYF